VVSAAGPASSITVGGFPNPTTTRVTDTFTVLAMDTFRNRATTYAGTVHFTSSDSQAILPADYTFVASDNGAHTFPATLTTPGTQSITATDTTNGTLTSTQTGIVVNPGPASSFTVAGFPSPTTAGAVHTFTVTAKDANGNTATGYVGTIYCDCILDNQATPPADPADYTFVAGDNGTHTFSVAWFTAGTESITVTDKTNGTLTGTQTGIVVNPAAASTLVVSGCQSPTDAGAALTCTVTAKDGYGNLATGYAGTVHFTSSDSQAVLPAAYTFVAGVAGDNGTHTFPVTLRTPGTQSITVTDTANGGLTSTQSGIVVNAVGVSTLEVAGFPNPTTAGVAHTFTVTAKDQYGNTVTGYTGTVHFTSSDSRATLPADASLTNGVGTFSATLYASTLFMPGSGWYIKAQDNTDTSLTGSQSIQVNPAVASTLVIAGFPSPTNAGAAHTFTVTANDAYGNLATTYAGTVHFTSTDANASLPTDYTFISGYNAEHTFPVTLRTPGTGSITATDTANGSFTGTQSGIVVNPGAASTLVIAGFSSPTNAGAAHTFTVTAKDANGYTATTYAGTVHFTSSDTQATLSADASLTNGVGTFSATLRTPGMQAIRATDAIYAGITGYQTDIMVSAATASTFVVAGFPSPTTAGVAHTFTVTAQDGFGNIATTYAGTVHFTSSDTRAIVPIDASLSSGVGTFSATFNTPGTQGISATDVANTGLTGTQSGIGVNAIVISSLVVAGFPSPTYGREAQRFTVTAKDANGNTVTTYAGTVRFTSSDGRATLPADAALTNGTGTFSASLNTLGTQSITATDTTNTALTGSQSGIVVNPAAASTLVVGLFPSATTAGVAHTFTVTAKDAFGNIATTYAGSVHFTSSDSQATLPADASLTNGVGTFSATLNTSGGQSIAATDVVDAGITGSSNTQIFPAFVSTFVVAGFPNPTTAGTAHTFTVTAKDANGNTVTEYTNRGVHLTSSDSQATLPANVVLMNGTGTFSATLNTPGTQSITASDVFARIAGSQSGIVVSPGPTNSFVAAGFPSSTTAGATQTITVAAQGSFGNGATGYTGTVHFMSRDFQATLPADYTFVAGDNGTHTFDVTLNTAGSQSITVTDTTNSSITSTQSGIVVNPAAASVFIISGFPSPTNAGAAHTFTVTAKDSFGNIATTYAGTVHFTSSDSQAALPANTSLTNGVGTFSATLNTSGSQSISATDAANTNLTGTQLGIIVNPTLVSISPSSGDIAGGTKVTLRGTGFAAGASVVFGTLPATNVTVVDSTTITANVPAHGAGTVDVKVTTGGITLTLGAAYTYGTTSALPGPRPTVPAAPGNPPSAMPGPRPTVPAAPGNPPNPLPPSR